MKMGIKRKFLVITIVLILLSPFFGINESKAASYSIDNWSTFPIINYGYTTSGAFVGFAQSLLYSTGLSHTVGTLDRSYGEKTRAAVRSFQSSSGLTADGSVGPNTWSRFKQYATRVPNGYRYRNGSTVYSTYLRSYAAGGDTVGYYWSLYFNGDVYDSGNTLWYN